MSNTHRNTVCTRANIFFPDCRSEKIYYRCGQSGKVGKKKKLKTVVKFATIIFIVVWRARFVFTGNEVANVIFRFCPNRLRSCPLAAAHGLWCVCGSCVSCLFFVRTVEYPYVAPGSRDYSHWNRVFDFAPPLTPRPYPATPTLPRRRLVRGGCYQARRVVILFFFFFLLCVRDRSIRVHLPRVWRASVRPSVDPRYDRTHTHTHAHLYSYCTYVYVTYAHTVFVRNYTRSRTCSRAGEFFVLISIFLFLAFSPKED